MNKEVKEIVGQLIVEIDKRTYQIFEIIEKDSFSYENDRALIHLLDVLAETLEVYQGK